MPAKKTEKIYLPDLERQLHALKTKKLRVGVPGEGELSKIAAVHEFGAVIKPKKGKYLAVPMRKEAKGRSPREFPGLKFIPSKKGSPVLAETTKTGKIKGKPYFVLLKEVIIPERALFRRTIDDSTTQHNAQKLAGAALQRLLSGQGKPEDVLAAIGASLVSDLRRTIADGLEPDNAPLTLALKKGAKPLADSGTFMRSVIYEIT